ncbi:MAG: hypothetical protein JWP12_638 [Bacteroidetes bacterium]|nr:hypothetical protein [Bacteroidota bacterium]
MKHVLKTEIEVLCYFIEEHAHFVFIRSYDNG